MKNKTLIKYARTLLKELLAQCSEPQQLMFKRMYNNKNLEAPVDEAVDQMEVDKLDFAVTQVENQIEKNKTTNVLAAIRSLKFLTCKKDLYKSTYQSNAFINGKEYEISLDEQYKENEDEIWIKDETGRPFTFTKVEAFGMYKVEEYFEL